MPERRPASDKSETLMTKITMTRRKSLVAGAVAVASACLSVRVAGQEMPPATMPASERWPYERWEKSGFRYWEVVRGSAFAPCAVHLNYETMLAGPTYPWHNVLLGKQFNYPTFIDPMGFTIPMPIEPAIIPPVYTLREPESDRLSIGYSTGGIFFAWMGVRVDPTALAPGAEKKLKDHASEWRGEKPNPDHEPRVFGIPTPPNEVEFWLSLHTPERTAEFQRHWKETPVDRPSIGPHISLRPPGQPRFFERED